MSRAEDILLLSEDGADRPLAVACAVAGALLDDLRRAGRIRIESEQVAVADAAATGETAMDMVLDRVAADGTATVADSDYIANSGTLTFTPGQTTQTLIPRPACAGGPR